MKILNIIKKKSGDVAVYRENFTQEGKEEVKQAIMRAIDAYGEACGWHESRMTDMAETPQNFVEFLEENPEVQEAINKAFLKIIDDYNSYRFGFYAVTAWQGGKCAEELEKQGKSLFNYGGL